MFSRLSEVLYKFYGQSSYLTTLRYESGQIWGEGHLKVMGGGSNKDLTLELRHASDPSADPAAVSEKVAPGSLKQEYLINLIFVYFIV